jgi:LCP family protein required for cell wall assembly
MQRDEHDQLGIRRGRSLRSPGLSRAEQLRLSAPFLSFLWPGLGQLQIGRWRWALAHALPPLALVLVVLFALVSAPETMALRLIVPSVALFVIALIAAHGLWRVVSIIDAWLSTRAGPLRADRGLPLVAVLSMIIVVTHVLAGLYVQDFSTAARPIFADGQPRPTPGVGAEQPPPTPHPGQPDDADDDEDVLDDILGDDLPTIDLGLGLDPGPGIPNEGPLTVLFVGVDSGPGRDHALTDTLMVGAFDRQRNEMALINVPRDTGRFPLYKGGVYNNRINSFLGFARRNPDLYPEGAIRALTNQMAFLVGIPIHYYAVIDMAGFERLVDLVGGVTVRIDYTIADPMRRLYLDPGRHSLDGQMALSFVRSRHGPNNSDYRRAQRQQQVIRAMADRLRDPGVAARLPAITREAARMARTNIPVDNLEAFLAVLDDVTDATPTRVVLQPRRYAQRIPPAEVGGRFMTELRMDAVSELSIELFGQFSLYYRRDRSEGPLRPTDLIARP